MNHTVYLQGPRTNDKNITISVPGTADYVLGSRRKQMKSQIRLFSLSSGDGKA
jgi:hypothetical protein